MHNDDEVVSEASEFQKPDDLLLKLTALHAQDAKHLVSVTLPRRQHIQSSDGTELRTDEMQR
jgi:hypothetical protein